MDERVRVSIDALCARIDAFVASTRQAVFVREADSLLMIRPDKTLQLNHTGVAVLKELYGRKERSAREVLEELGAGLDVPLERLAVDAETIVDAVGAVLNEDYTPRPGLRFGSFDRGIVRYPTLAEIAVTYGCQNRCRFCYASSPHRSRRQRPMTSEQIQVVMAKIYHQAHAPSLSFTGGEATLRPDLEELIRAASGTGFRVNLITNGIRLADQEYAERLVDAGLDSAQISLEAGCAEIHDRIVGRSGAFAATIRGVQALRQLGIHVHTNTTLCPPNLDHAAALIRFVAGDLGLRTLSMNMVIRTGDALAGDEMRVSYEEIARRLPGLLAVAREVGVRLVWYSPIPYCIFNPVLHGLGAKSCACIDGIVSVDPTGQLLPCSSFATGIGSLLERDFDELWESRTARYWRRKEFIPLVCRECPDSDVCAGACPLYWDAAGTFAEIPRHGSDDARQRERWDRHRLRGGSFGVPAPAQAVERSPRWGG